MSEQAYLVEVVYRVRPRHDLYDTLDAALAIAACQLEAWILCDNADQRYDPAAKAQVKSLLDEKRYAEALDTWKRHFPAQPVTVREVEITKRNCHHDPCPTISEGTWYVVETEWVETGWEHDLLTGLNQALDCVRYIVTHLPSHCNRATWRTVWRLLRLGRVADAIDVWNSRTSDPQIAIHQIRREIGTFPPALGGNGDLRED
jgi:hypothetical protein